MLWPQEGLASRCHQNRSSVGLDPEGDPSMGILEGKGSEETRPSGVVQCLLRLAERCGLLWWPCLLRLCLCFWPPNLRPVRNKEQ